MPIPTCLEDYTCQVSSPYKVFNLLAVANMSEKNTSLFGVPRKPPPTATHLNNETF